MHLTEDPLSLETLLTETANDESGALVIFGGTVRNLNDGQPVLGMSYSAYTPLAEKTLRDIETEALARYAITACRLIHRTGRLALGELSVLVVVRAAHRPAAFEAARWAIDTLKQRVPVWKEEHYVQGDSRFLEGTSLVNHPEQST